MIWTAWNNGSYHASGAGYGFKVDANDRDRYFRHNWGTVFVELPRGLTFARAEVNVTKSSFWVPQCDELISQVIGRWLLDEGYAPWPQSASPKFEVDPAGDRRFVLKGCVA